MQMEGHTEPLLYEMQRQNHFDCLGIFPMVSSFFLHWLCFVIVKLDCHLLCVSLMTLSAFHTFNLPYYDTLTEFSNFSVFHRAGRGDER